jgi:hypothetical protein
VVAVVNNSGATHTAHRVCRTECIGA